MGLRATGKVAVSIRGLRENYWKSDYLLLGGSERATARVAIACRGTQEGPNARKGMVPRLDPEKGRLLAE
jgi:hypothetical protein